MLLPSFVLLSSAKILNIYHEGQDQTPDVVPDLGGDVVAELLQRGQEALQLAQLARPAGGRQLLVGQRRG